MNRSFTALNEFIMKAHFLPIIEMYFIYAQEKRQFENILLIWNGTEDVAVCDMTCGGHDCKYGLVRLTLRRYVTACPCMSCQM
jgi:hypothetical protein